MPANGLRQGAIVYAKTVPDTCGRNHKDRRVVIVSPDEEIASSATLFVVAITSQVESSPPATSVKIAWKASGHPRTSLDRPSVAVCNWILELPKSSLEAVRGHCTTQELDDILDRIAQLN